MPLDPHPLAVDPARLDMPARRRLLRGGLGATPVLMTLTSAPVSAAVCTQASAFASLQASGQREQLTCSGRTPEAWNSVPFGSWPVGASTRFGELFQPALNPEMKIKDLLALTTPTPVQGLARHLTAAYMNAAVSTFQTSAVLSQSKAQQIWTSFATNGYYEPTAGIRWMAADIVAWIRTTYV